MDPYASKVLLKTLGFAALIAYGIWRVAAQRDGRARSFWHKDIFGRESRNHSNDIESSDTARSPSSAKKKLDFEKIEKIRRLEEAFNNDVLTIEEFETKKAAILGQCNSSSSRNELEQATHDHSQNDGPAKTTVQTSEWRLDVGAGEITKDVLVYLGKELSQRILVKYICQPADSLSPPGEGDSDLDELMSKHPFQHVGIILSPPLGAGEGFLVLQASMTKAAEKTNVIVRTGDQEDYSVLMLQDRYEVHKLVELFSSEDDIVCEVKDMNEVLIRRFVIPNAGGFAKLKQEIL